MRISDWSSDVCSSDLLIDREAIGVEAMAIAAVGKPVRIATPPLASGIFAQQHLNIPPHIVRHDGKAASSEWIGRQGNLGPAVKKGAKRLIAYNVEGYRRTPCHYPEPLIVGWRPVR